MAYKVKTQVCQVATVGSFAFHVPSFLVSSLLLFFMIRNSVLFFCLQLYFFILLFYTLGAR